MTEDAIRRRWLEDELMVVDCQLGERRAFDALIERWHRPLWIYVHKLAGRDDVAADIVQEVWLRVLRGIAGLRDGGRLRAWLFGIARRTWIDHLRSRYAIAVADDVDADELVDEGSLEDPLIELEAMQEELARLPVIERDVLTLFHLRELSLNEVAEVLDVPQGTVKSRLFRARRLLRDQLQSRGVGL